jgi:MFS family permease
VSFRVPPALRHRRFTILWLGLLVSIAGSHMPVAAIHWHIRELSAVPNPLALGGIGLARILPIVIFSLIGGAAADTFNRRTILLITQSIMALCALGLAALTYRGQIEIWQIYALTAIAAGAIAFDLPARQAMVPNLLPPDDLPSAFSMTSIAFNTGAIVGPALSGIVIAGLGQGYTYFFNAISYLAVIASLIAIGSVAQDTSRSPGVRVSAIVEGVRFIFARKIILSSMLLDFFATFFASTNTLMPIIARDLLRVGVTGYGWLVAAQPIGAVIAALVVSQAQVLRRQGRLLVGAVIAFGVSTMLFGLANAFLLAMLMLVAMGAADAVSTIIRNTIRQLQTPDTMRGRMTSINQVFFQGGPQFGEVEAGIVAQFLGVTFAIISGGIGTIVATMLIIRRWPVLLAYNGDEPVPLEAFPAAEEPGPAQARQSAD